MKRIAPRTYVDAQGRYHARYPVNGRYTWRLLKETTKREAIAAAQAATGNVSASGFAALARLWIAAKCPTSAQKFKRPSDAYLVGETRQAEKLIEYFRNQPVAAVNNLLQIEAYKNWRLRQFKDGKGTRAVDKETQTLSNVINYAVFGTQQERLNYIKSNRPKYHVVKTHARDRMPGSAAVVHRLADYFFRKPVSEVFGWMTLFQMFMGVRTSELLRLQLNAAADEAGHVAAGHLHLGRRSKSGVNPYCIISPEFAEMLACFHRWHKTRFPRHQPYFPGPFGNVVSPPGHGHALTRACKQLGLPHLSPHGLRAYYVTKHRREGITDAAIAAQIGDKTVALISTIYGDIPGGQKLAWLPDQGLPAWQLWLPAQQKIVRLRA